MKKPLATLGALGLGAALWGHFEAGWVRLRSIPVPIPGLPEELDGLRIVHLSDFHLGFPSRGERAVQRAIDWTAAREPDLVVITGDLLSRPRRRAAGCGSSSTACRGRSRCSATTTSRLSRDPFSKPSAVSDLASTTVLFDEAQDGRAPRPHASRSSASTRAPTGSASSRPVRARRPGRGPAHPALPLPERDRPAFGPATFDLVLAGHLHAGQIVRAVRPRKGPVRAPALDVRRGSLPAARAACSTSRPAWARRSSRSASSRGRRRPSSF